MWCSLAEKGVCIQGGWWFKGNRRGRLVSNTVVLHKEGKHCTQRYTQMYFLYSMRKCSSNLHSLIRHPGECCAWFLALIMEPVNQLEKCQGEQRERLEISPEASSDLTEEDGPSHEMKINCGTPCPSYCGWKTRLHKFTRQTSMKDWPSIKTRRLHGLGRVPKEGHCVLVQFSHFSNVCPWPLLGMGPKAKQTLVWPWESLLHSEKHLRRDGRNWGEVSGEVCCIPVMYIKSSFKEKRVRSNSRWL